MQNSNLDDMLVVCENENQSLLYFFYLFHAMQY